MSRLSTEEHVIEVTRQKRQPAGAPAQEKASRTSQWLELGLLQEQLPPPPIVRPGEQPTPGTCTRKEEKEETSDQEALSGE